MAFPLTRMRRLRQGGAVRRLLREARVHPHDLVAPLFVVEGKRQRRAISSLPGQFHLSVDRLAAEAAALQRLGVPALMLFGIPASSAKTADARLAMREGGIVQRAVAELKKRVPGILLITDVCVCEYTSHGHCGIVEGAGKARRIANDPTLEVLAGAAVSHADAGADWVAPSDMMDGRVSAIRSALDSAGHGEVGILSYAAKFSSAFYGPFREAAASAPAFGDRKSHQMEPANAREALREMQLDLEEGADILMVKPGLPYLDIIAAARRRFPCPIASYNVSGEYSMVHAAAARGWGELAALRDESLLSLKRAGSDLIVTYWARSFAEDFRRRGGLDAP